MKNAHLLIIIILIAYCHVVKSQSDIPMSLLLPNDSLFGCDDLRKNKISVAICNEILYRFCDLMRPDTQAVVTYNFDSLYRVESVTYINAKNLSIGGKGSQCYYEYLGNITNISCRETISSWDCEPGIYKSLNFAVYKNGLFVKRLQTIYDMDKNLMIQSELDTVLYDKNGNDTLALTIYSEHLTPSSFDTLIIRKKYDKRGRLILHQILPPLPSKTKMGTPHIRFSHKESTFAFSYDSAYTYSKHFIIGMFTPDTSVVSEEKTLNMVSENNLVIKKIESVGLNSVDYHLKLNDLQNDRAIEYFLSETKIQTNKVGSVLPERIIIVEADAIRVFYFEYL